MNRAFVFFSSLCISLVLGCGSGEKEMAVGTQTVSKTDQVRSWAEGVAQSGQLDSGAELIMEDIEAMGSEGIENYDEIKRLAQELISQKSPSAVKSKAEALLEALPAKQ